MDLSQLLLKTRERGKLNMNERMNELLDKYEEKMKKENETMNEKEYIIAKAKELGITAEELGIQPVTKVVMDMELVEQIKEIISNGAIDSEEARDWFSEKYWDDLGIAPKKYKLVECTLRKTIYKKTMVAMPEDEDESNVEDYLSDMDMEIDTDSPDDEEDWEIDDYTTADDNLTEEDVRDAYSEDEVYNYHNFAD